MFDRSKSSRIRLVKVSRRVALPAILILSALNGCNWQDSRQDPGPTASREAHEHSHDHPADQGNATELVLTTRPDPPKAGEPTQLKAMIHRADGSMVQDFEVIHEKKVHLILVRKGLNQFAHLHPELDEAGNATVEYSFPTGGDYFVYADHQPAGGSQSTAKATIKVDGDAPAAPELAENVPGTVSGDDLTAEIAVEKAGQGRARSVVFSLRNASGEPVTDLENYLGARGHLVIVSQDGQDYVHAHPEENVSSSDDQVTFEAHFTKPGLYKGWGQFQRSGEVATVPFVVRVD
jgi:hypothetical protein